MATKTNCCPDNAQKETRGSNSHGTVIYLNSTVMGRGDDTLGAKLLGVFLDTLSHFAPRVSHLLLVNGGVRLACVGSPVLEQLQGLTSTHIEILSCATCLNHFGLADQLEVGKVSNMMEIIEVQTRAQRLITP